MTVIHKLYLLTAVSSEEVVVLGYLNTHHVCVVGWMGSRLLVRPADVCLPGHATNVSEA